MINSISSQIVLGTQDQANWLVAWFTAHSATTIPVVMTLGAALVLHVVAGWMISRTARRMKAKGFIWSAAIASG